MSRTTTRTKKEVNRANVRTVPVAAAAKRPKKNGPARAALPTTWFAAEYVPRKRRWWFVRLSLVAVWFSVLMILLREWYVLAFVVVATAAMFVSYLPTPRRQTWTLTATTLTVDKTVIQLEKYRAFTIEELPATGRELARPSVTLLPKARLGWPFPVYLPGGELDESVVESIAGVLPQVDAEGYQASTRVLNRLTRWLRLG